MSDPMADFEEMRRKFIDMTWTPERQRRLTAIAFEDLRDVLRSIVSHFGMEAAEKVWADIVPLHNARVEAFNKWKYEGEGGQ